jgi:hypothetical protein
MAEELETEVPGILINAIDIIKFSDDGRLMRDDRNAGPRETTRVGVIAL